MVAVVVCILTMAGCSAQKNTAKSRWWQAFNTRYNVYYNGKQAFIAGELAKETGNKDNYTEMIPLYPVANKTSKELGKSNFETAITKCQKAIKLHSIKRRPEWTKNRRKTAKDIEWLNRKEYNPFLWNAWLLMGKSLFQSGRFDEAASMFSYMSRMYATQPEINGIARAWLAKSYVELDWIYDAEDVIVKMRRDTMHYRAVKEWDYTYADYYIRSGQYEQAVLYLRKVIKHEKRCKLKARQWFLMGQLQSALGNKEMAYKAYRHVTRLNPPYELAFNARIAQTEVMAEGASKKMIRKLRRMAASDNNKDYLDQVYYAMGNIYLLEKDTLRAISTYEEGNKKATRSGIEKGVLLLKLGNIYWEREKYSDAKRCYGEAIGLLDKERDDYEELSNRSKVLDELVPFTEAVHLQDSLQALAKMSEEERNKAIDRVIEALIKKEEEEKRAAQEAEVQKQQAAQGALGNTLGKTTTTSTTNSQGLWYFYNPMAVNQGKAAFQKQWGKRENADNWQRINQTVVNLNNTDEGEASDSISVDGEDMAEGEGGGEGKDGKNPDEEAADSAANDPHKREYYLAQIPFTEEQVQASNEIIKDGLFNSGVIFKDKLDNLTLSEKTLIRLTTQYADFTKNDEAYYHLFLLYSRLHNDAKAQECLATLKSLYPQSQWTILLSDPYYAENAKFGVHIEDSIYGATYDAFKENRFADVSANAKLSRERFPLGANRPKFLFIEGLSELNEGRADSCVARLTEVVEKHPKSEVAELAGMIVKGVQAGRRLYGGKFDLGDVWSRRSMLMESSDSTLTDTLKFERNTGFVFMLAFQPDSVNTNQLLYEMARYNFSNFMVRNFDMTIDEDNGIVRMLVRGFLSYDEALQYARQLYAAEGMPEKLTGCRRIIISDDNLKLLGTKYNYVEYQKFFDDAIAPVKISDEPLLTIPDEIVQPEEEESTGEEGEDRGNPDDDLFGNGNNNNNTNQGGFDFDEEFYQ